MPFSRLSKGKVLNPTGVGLGLISCRNILDQLGGKIWIESSIVLKDFTKELKNYGTDICFQMLVHKATSQKEIFEC